MLLQAFSGLSIPYFRRGTWATGSMPSLEGLVALSEEYKKGGPVDEERV